MGNTRSYYEKLLKQKLQKLYNEKIAEGGMAAITDQDLEKVLEEVKKDLDRAEPKKSQLKKTFKKFCDEQRELKRTEQPKNLAYDDKSRKIFVSNDKYDQYKQDRNAFLKSCLKTIKKDIAADAALDALDLRDAQGRKVKPTARWRNYLIREDGSDKSREHNQEFLALLALGTKKITKDQFIQVRKKHYTGLPDGALSAEEAEKKAREESERVGERLWEMGMETLNATAEKRGIVPAYASYILSGRAGKQGYPTVEQCHKIADDQDLNFIWDLEKFTDDINQFGGLKDPKGVKQFQRDRQEEGNKVGNSIKQAEIASNFYFSMIDPFKLIDREEPLNLEMPSNRKGTHDESMRYAFSQDCMGQQANLTGQIQEKITRFGLDKRKDRIIMFPDKDPVMRVVRRETLDAKNQKVVQTAVLRSTRLNNIGPLNLYATEPENLVNDGLEDSVKGFIDTCKDWSREHRTSNQFERMRGALENLQDKKLDRFPTQESIVLLRAQLKLLRDRSQDYLDYKIRQRKGEHFRYGFERKRVKLAKKMNEFARKKLEELQYVKEHIATQALEAKMDTELRKDPEYIEALKNGYQGGALGYLREKEENAIIEQEKRARAQEQEAIAEQRRQEAQREELEKKEKRKELFSKITDLKKDCRELSKDHVSAAEQVSRYIEDVKAKRPALLAEKEPSDEKKEAQAKQLAAGRVVEKMLIDEQEALSKDPNADCTIHELVNGGKLKNLTEMLIQDELFKEQLRNRGNGISDASYQNVEIQGDYPYYVSRSFREKLAKAAEEQKEEAVNIEDQKEEVKAVDEIGQKEDVKEPVNEVDKKEDVKEPDKEVDKKEDVKEPPKDPKRSLVEGGIAGLMKEAGLKTENKIAVHHDPVLAGKQEIQNGKENVK